MLEPLHQLHDMGCTAYVAGGAVRDTVLGRPVKDIDIFIWHFNHDPSRGLSQSQQKSWQGLRPGDDAESWLTWVFDNPTWEPQANHAEQYHGGSFIADEAYNISPHIEDVVNLRLRNIEYQFITTTIHPLEYVNQYFDINLCRGWCDGTKMSLGTAFMQDWHNKTITVSGDLTRAQYQYTIYQHLPRVVAKYPDYTVVIDPELTAKYPQASGKFTR